MMKLNKEKSNICKSYQSLKKSNFDVGVAVHGDQKGITLIALVITIVVLIILAGVAINMTLGQNGIFNKAKQAKEQYKMAEVKEEIELAILDIKSEKLGKNEQCTLDTIISELPGKISGLTISKDGDNAKGTYNGCDFTITPDLKVTVDGYTPSTGGSSEENTPPTPTIYSVTFNGTNVTSNGEESVNENETYTATLTAKSGYEISSVTVTMGGTELVENTGYTYSSGNLSIQNVSGNIVITAVVYSYDNPYIPVGFTHIGTEDWNSGYRISDTGDETGNIFVWVPCVLDQSKVKAEHTVQTFKKTLPSTTSTTDPYYMYNKSNYTITEDIGPANAIKTSVGIYGGFYIAAYEAGIAGEIENYSLSTKTATNGSVPPLSKPGCGVWNYITRTDALTVAEHMVDTSTTGVKSGLISGECWDTTLQWMVNSSTNHAEQPNAGYDTNSAGKGWYNDVSSSTRRTTGYRAVNNIYDMAGNVWEWTTENCTDER